MSASATTPPARAEPTGSSALVRLAAFVAAVIVLAAVLHGLDVLIVVAALVVMVMLHEFGHFVTAKLSGMKVTEYFFGFGPRLWSMRRGETEYGVKAIPAGGYVRIVGMTMLEEVDPADEARSYRQATFPRRFTVAVAGSAMHFIVAFGLLWGMVAFTGLPVAVPNQEVTALIAFANRPNPAKVAGVRVGDVLVAVDGHHFKSLDRFISFIEGQTGAALRLVVRRDGRLVGLSVTPVDGRRAEIRSAGGRLAPEKTGDKPIGVIGVELGGQTLVTASPFDALGRAGTVLGREFVWTGEGIGQVFSLHGLRAFAHDVATANSNAASTTPAKGSSHPPGATKSGEILSLPGAVEIAVQALQINVTDLLSILVAINVFVGMVNLFPMLPLDGGHVVIAVYERIRSRRGRAYHLDVNKLMPVAYVFLAFIVVIGLGALYVNILQPPHLPGG
ncbi:MAG: M50 family metallopeptidase [Acidimicrobiales bacterium]